MTAGGRFRGVISVGNYTLPQGEALIITLYRAAEADRRNTAGKRFGKKMSKSVDKGTGVCIILERQALRQRMTSEISAGSL